MEEEEDDHIYAPSKQANGDTLQISDTHLADSPNRSNVQDEESGEEVAEEESDSDIDIITEKKEDPKKGTVQDPRVNSLKSAASARSPSGEPAVVRHESLVVKSQTARKESPSRFSASYPAIKTSTLDVHATPTHEPSGKQITDVDLDTDFGDDDKPWRRPGTDMTDFFNYGFDEFTWASYCLKQKNLRKETSDSKKQLDDMQSFLNSGAPPGMPGAGAGAGMSQMPGMADIPPEMQQMFGQMMAQGMDPSQMDPSQFMQMMSGGQGGQGGDQAQGYGNQGYGLQQHQQPMGYNNYGGGNQGGRGRRGRW